MTGYPRGSTLNELFDARVAMTPGSPAVVCGEGVLTYEELHRRARSIAAGLQSKGLGGTRIALLMDRSIDFVASVLGVVQAGGAYVPVDAGSPPARIATMLERASCSAVLCDPGLRDRLGEAPARPALWVQELAAVGADAWMPVESVDPLAEAYVMFTSGSTGEPKGVRVPHRAIVRLAHGAEVFALGPGSTTAFISNVAFDASTFELWCPLLHGGRIAVVEERVPSLATLRDALRRHEISCMYMSAGLFNTTIDERPEVLAPVRSIIVGGEALSAPHIRRAQRCHPEASYFNGYGPTECTTFSAVHAIPHDLAESVARIPIGRPLVGTSAYILDESMTPVPVGATGELWIGGDAVGLGYVADEALTAARFVPDPFAEAMGADEPGATMYRSGDLCRWLEDGTIDFVGRVDRQVKLRGFRIEPGEIEAVVCSHPAVQRCVVVVEDGRIVAHVVAHELDATPLDPGSSDPGSCDPAALRAHAALALPEYMVPTEFACVGRIPLTPNGKVDLSALRASADQARAHADRAVDASAARLVAPRDDTESRLAGLWRDVLEVAEVGVHDSFFDLGGHSLHAMVLGARIGAAFGREITPVDLLRHPTIAEQAVLLGRDGRDDAGLGTLPTPGTCGVAPASFGQRRMWYLDQVERAGVAYNESWALEMPERPDLDRLQHCISILQERHPVLRTSYRLVDGDVEQHVHEATSLALAEVDLAPTDGVLQGRSLDDLVRSEVRRPFDLACGPLIRVTMIRAAERRHVLLFVLHHICCDDWSMRLYLDELARLYDASGEPSADVLPPLAYEYRQFALDERSRHASQHDEARSFWRDRLRSAPLSIPLQVDRPRASTVPAGGDTLAFGIDAPVARALAHLARIESTSSFVLYLAVFGAVLHARTRADELVIASPISLRSRREFMNVFGYFLNTLPLRLDCSSGLTFRNLVQRTRATVLSSFQHADLPLEQVLAEAHVRRGGSGVPLLNVAFVWLDDPPPTPKLGGIRTSHVPVHDNTSKFELALALRPAEAGGLDGILEYSTELFERKTIQLLVDELRIVCEQLALEPDAPIERLGHEHAEERSAAARRSEVRDSSVRSVAAAARAAEPETGLERELLSLWRELLETPLLSVEDDFFDAGGHSLMAMRLVARIEQSLGTTVPLNVLLQAPTVRALARHIETARSERSCVLIPVQPEGTSPPLIFAPGLGGSAFIIPELQDRLGRQQPIHAIAMNHVATSWTLEQIAAEHVGSLVEQWPSGPFRLVGFSLGGTIAFEIARQLEHMGRCVELLAIVDQGLFMRWNIRSAWGAVANIPHWGAELVTRPPSRLARTVRLKGRAMLRRAGDLLRGGEGRQRLAVEDFVDLSNYSVEQRCIARRTFEAQLAYGPQPYRGSVVVFRARRQPLISPVEHDLGWGRLVEGSVRVHVIPGGHMASMEPPGSAVFARRLAAELRALDHDAADDE